MRSAIRIDLGALRRNARRLIDALQGSELWAVVKADGYGHGAADAARAALEAGAAALCVVTVPEATALRGRFREARIVVMGPVEEPDLRTAREARLELVVGAGSIPDDIPVHLKLDTGMGRYGYRELPEPTENVVGLMTHLATADTDRIFAERQLELLPPGGGALSEAALPCRQLGRRPPDPGSAVRRRTLRRRAVRPLSVRQRSRGGRSRAGARLAQPSGAGEAARAGREHGLRPPLRRRAARHGSASSRSATGTASAATSPGPRCWSPASAAARSAPSRWTRSRSSCRASCPRARR